MIWNDALYQFTTQFCNRGTAYSHCKVSELHVKMYHSKVPLFCVPLLLLSIHGQIATAQLQRFSPRVLKSVGDESCIAEDQLEAVRSRVKRQILGIIEENIAPKLCQSGLYENIPAESCRDIHQDCPSGYYWLNVPNGDPLRTYCTSNKNHCCHNNDRKWMRIGYLNMSEPDASCPDGWREVSTPIRSCRRNRGSYVNSLSYSSNGIPYSRVCGKIVSYQYGTPEAFGHYSPSFTLDSQYADGISITYGSPRRHIWTFVAGVARVGQACPCSGISSGSIRVPGFIDDHYFCELGANVTGSEIGNLRFIRGNPLWDGKGCTGSSTCCEYNNPPWFCRELPQPTTEDIEVRSMTTAAPSFLELEDSPIQLMEIYVQ